MFLVSSLSHAQATKIELMCVAPGEPLMIFKANLTQESSQYFSLSQSTWERITYTEVKIEELILMPNVSGEKRVYLTGSGSTRGYRKIHINRTNLQFFTNVTVDLDGNGTTRTGSCTVHTFGEIDQIASRSTDVSIT